MKLYIHITHRLLLLCLLWAIPLVTSAVTPVNVTGIAASEQNGQIVVRWEPVTLAEIKEYHVYISRASILQNNGAYDDIEVVPGNQSQHTITQLPVSEQVFISVIAVNQEGEKSTFSEEAVIARAPLNPDIIIGEPGIPTTLRLISAVPVSSTGVLLTFNTNVNIPYEKAPEAFRITNSSGAQVILTRLVIDGKTVRIESFPYSKHATYLVTMSSIVEGNHQSTILKLDPTASSKAFTATTGAIGTWVGSIITTPTKPTKPGDLSDTGLSILGLTMAAGAVAGWVREKRKA